MNLKSILKQTAVRFLGLTWHSYAGKTRQYNNVNILLQSALSKYLDIDSLNHPVAFIEFLRGCFEPQKRSLTTIKTVTSENRIAENQFQALLKALRENVPPIRFSTAVKIAKIADEYHGNYSVPEVVTRMNGTIEKGFLDIGYRFARGSSFAKKGRFLSAVIRFCRPHKCLELGTFYGMSALFILAAQEANGSSPNLTTIEGYEPGITYSSRLLRQHYSNAVKFIHGYKKDELPKLAKSSNKFGFLFHDAGHRGEDYINDFLTLLPVLEPGAAVVFDDIRWDKNTPQQELLYIPKLQCYKGWQEVVSHDRVLHAVEVGRDIGLLLLK